MRKGIKFQIKNRYGFTSLGTGTYTYKSPDAYTAFLEFKERMEKAHYNYKLRWNNDGKTYTIVRTEGWGPGASHTEHVKEIWFLPLEHPEDIPF